MDGSCFGAATRVVRARTATEAEAVGFIAVMDYIDRADPLAHVAHTGWAGLINVQPNNKWAGPG
ncbi:hypothetical protein A2U01_0029685 [Trifolium medium]|uniref:Uncharacterized protein n=1 Tax=Trifolium medium TaxID=97028 RepID=A0A392P965_9FABA|nr:hypothetical protein [Trifolium medium]